METEKILFIDTETGGLDPLEHSLLSIGFVVWQKNRILDKIEILINDGKLNVSKSALEINKIDIENHRKNALTPREAITIMDNFLIKHFNESEKITLAGHNINFDINFFKYFLLKNNYNFIERFSHRTIDTSAILYYLYLSGKLEININSSTAATILTLISAGIIPLLYISAAHPNLDCALDIAVLKDDLASLPTSIQSIGLKLFKKFSLSTILPCFLSSFA